MSVLPISGVSILGNTRLLFNAYKVQKEVKLLVYNCLKLRFTSSDQSGGAHTKHFKMKQQQATKWKPL